MREELRKLYGKHKGFTATIGDYGRFHDLDGKVHNTICLNNIKMKDTGEEIVDHMWIQNDYIRRIKKGSKIQFRGQVARYYKGHAKCRRLDYCIDYIQRVKVIK